VPVETQSPTAAPTAVEPVVPATIAPTVKVTPEPTEPVETLSPTAAPTASPVLAVDPVSDTPLTVNDRLTERAWNFITEHVVLSACTSVY
jgi:hypothetical protein